MPKQVNFHLIVDEERAEIMQVCFGLLIADWDGYRNSHPQRAEQLAPALKDFVKEFSDKVHAVGMCKDENCKI